MYCAQCGKPIRPGTNFCGACGAPVQPVGHPQQPVVHPQQPVFRPQQPVGQPQRPVFRPQQPFTPVPYTQNKKGRTALLTVLVIAAILAAAILAAVFVIPRIILGPGAAGSAQIEQTVSAGSSEEVEPLPTEPPAEEPADADTPLIQAAAGSAVEVAGTYIHVPGVRGFLQLEQGSVVEAPDASGEMRRVDNVYSIAVIPTEQVTDAMLEQCNSTEMLVTGPLYFDEKNEPCIEAQSITDTSGQPLEFPEEG